MFTPITSSLRFTEPKIELSARDRRSGAYPTKARTGDRTRSGRNKFYFDDTRTVLFMSGVSVNLPSTFQAASAVDADLTGSVDAVIGNVISWNVDQWIPHREQVENAGPFLDNGLFEQDETNTVNSAFMTGSAYYIAPDRFKSKLSNKTIIRITLSLSQDGTLSANTSSMYYVNVTNGTLDLVGQPQRDGFHGFTRANAYPTQLLMYDQILFGPFGYLNCPNSYSPSNWYNRNLSTPSVAMPQINTFVPNGSTLFDPGSLNNLGVFSRTNLSTGSLIETKHSASAHQSIELSDYLAAPFLLEKAVVEFNFAAGPGWMNDAYAIASFFANSGGTSITDKHIDAGGPMVTVGLLRQDNAGLKHRDLIASATFTNAYEATTASYLLSSHSINDSGGSGVVASNLLYTRVGLSGTVDPTVIVRGPVLSGSTNYFTGAIKLTMMPAVTHHITRVRLSGTSEIGFYNGSRYSGTSLQDARTTMADVVTFGSPTRRPGVFESGRSILGNNVALLPNTVDGTTTPINGYEPDYEGLTGKQSDTNKTQHGKVYWDVVTATKHSPYLLYPNDNLVLCINKHRACANSMSFDATNVQTPNRVEVRAQHDAKILSGAITITLYGDLIREDREFHDTLNQRLETEEIWETIGEEPVLDQFDVFYSNELSGSAIDRFTTTRVYNVSAGELTSSNETEQLYSHFTAQNYEQGISTQYAWSKAIKVNTLRTNTKAWQLKSEDELFWDCRLVNPQQAMLVTNPSFQVVFDGEHFPTSGGHDGYSTLTIFSGIDTFQPSAFAGSVNVGPYGAGDWWMAYPFESRFYAVPTQFDLDADTFTVGQYYVSNASRTLTYNRFMLKLGNGKNDTTYYAGDLDKLNTAGTVFALPTSEFIKMFYGIGDVRGPIDNNHVGAFLSGSNWFGSSHLAAHGGNILQWTGCDVGARIRGWKRGMLNGFKTYSKLIFRRDHYGQFRDMLEQRVDAKYWDSTGVKSSPVQVTFHDNEGNIVDATRTLSNNLSFEAANTLPFEDYVARDRAAYSDSSVNISRITF